MQPGIRNTMIGLHSGLHRRLMYAAVAAALSALLPAAVRAAEKQPARLPMATPAEVGMSAQRLAVIDRLAEQGIREGKLPGCVVAIGRRGKLVLVKAYGNRQTEPEPQPMTVDTLFDMASVTKPVATASSIFLLIDAGKLSLDDLVSKHIPEFAQNGKEKVTILQLLTHQSGLIPDNSIRDYAMGHDEAFRNIFALEPQSEPGTRFRYSDVGFLVLGELVHRISGKPLDQFSQSRIFEPLGMTETGYRPAEELRARAAPTEHRDGKWIRGEVHDPRAFALGGVAGHAGLFSTAADLAVYAQMLLNGGTSGSTRILSTAAVGQMTAPQPVSSGVRTAGWDMRTGYSTNGGDLRSDRAFGHGGFTGTGLWIDPQTELFVIFLSNRVHPNGKGVVNPLIGRISTVAQAAILETPTAAVPVSASPAAVRPATSPTAAHPPQAVLTGLDVLERDRFQQLKGRKVGLITNHTAVNRKGIGIVELFQRAPEVRLLTLFSPEHGFEGKLDVAQIANDREAKSGLKIFSLYGKTRSPTAESLQGLDTLVFDIQDIGTRFYTYPSTMGLAMKAAAEHQLRFVVLDRPNPINGVDVAGPVLDAGRESFVGFHTLPVRHGMTIGELARLFKAELQLELDLQVIDMEGWQRSDMFDETGLPWINPSPNMRSLTEAVLYPGIGLLETTNVSVGRGTDRPFELVGAPWIDGIALAGRLNQAGLPGVRFVPVRFTPESSKFAGKECGGIDIQINDRQQFKPLRTGLTIARELLIMYPKQWEFRSYDRLLSDQQTMDALSVRKTVHEIELLWEPELQKFRKRRAGVLRYKPL